MLSLYLGSCCSSPRSGPDSPFRNFRDATGVNQSNKHPTYTLFPAPSLPPVLLIDQKHSKVEDKEVLTWPFLVIPTPQYRWWKSGETSGRKEEIISPWDYVWATFEFKNQSTNLLIT
jgi:hypothetical protein